MTPDEFLADITKAKDLIEQAVGRPVLGHRCPGFSVTEQTPWFFEKVVEAGYRYDSSVFPAPRGHGGLTSDRLAPYVIDTPQGPLIEFPITVTKVLGRPLCFFGGGYLRLSPYALTKRMGRRVLREQRPVVFYVHPREIDPHQPRLPMKPLRRFKSYVGIDGTKQKLRRIVRDFDLTTFESYITNHQRLGATDMSATTPNDRTSTFFHGYAQDFSDIYGNKNTLLNSIINELFRKSMKLRYLKTLAGCDPIDGCTVIDIGCGPGHYSVELARRGAKSVYGVDFAQGMIDLAAQHAIRTRVKDRCKFELQDFHELPGDSKFDYTVVMGFMDYMSDPRKVVSKVLSLTKRRAFFSFPIDGGMLAWQRKLRYRNRCDLFMYTEGRIREIFSSLPHQKLQIEKAARDYFVTATMS